MLYVGNKRSTYNKSFSKKLNTATFLRYGRSKCPIRGRNDTYAHHAISSDQPKRKGRKILESLAKGTHSRKVAPALGWINVSAHFRHRALGGQQYPRRNRCPNQKTPLHKIALNQFIKFLFSAFQPLPCPSLSSQLQSPQIRCPITILLILLFFPFLLFQQLLFFPVQKF